MEKAYSFIILFLFSPILYCQSISGTITDKTSGEALIGVNIILENGNGTASDIPSFELELTGPDNILSGNKAEFSANIKNTGNVATGESTLDLSWDDSFSPLEASDGYVLGPSKVSWDLPSIQPGDRLRRQLLAQS